MLHPTLRGELEARVGAPLELRVVRRQPHRVVEVRGPGGQVWCKWLGGGRAYAQTLVAHRAWPDALPRLLYTDDGQRCVVLGHVEGAPPAPDDHEAHEAAGRWLRRVHAGSTVPWGAPDSMPLEEAMQRRARSWLEGVSGRLGGAELRGAAELLADVRGFAGERRVPCHRDFGPHNWLLTSGGELVVLDPEHARPDHWLADVVKLAADDWSDRPSLEGAFSRGYGRTLDARERSLLRPWLVGHALMMLSWGDRHGDEDLSTKGRRLLRRLLEGRF